MRLLPKLKIISWTWTWLSTQLCFELFYFCIIAHSLQEKYMRQRDKISFPFHVSPIYLPWHNKFLKPKSGECCLVSLCFFHYLSYLSFIFLAFSLITTVSQDIIKLEWGTSHPSVVAYRHFRPHTLSHVALLLWHVWKEEEIPDIPQLDLMAQLWITFDI